MTESLLHNRDGIKYKFQYDLCSAEIMFPSYVCWLGFHQWGKYWTDIDIVPYKLGICDSDFSASETNNNNKNHTHTS